MKLIKDYKDILYLEVFNTINQKIIFLFIYYFIFNISKFFLALEKCYCCLLMEIITFLQI